MAQAERMPQQKVLFGEGRGAVEKDVFDVARRIEILFCVGRSVLLGLLKKK
jgi:hypothetical protein